ncbi:MAG TPA: YggS family pyridoxal phosphate-dependent enzyme [Rudaea sp.]|nr:YggS family pyridoxal phosphate-dependent enzyme [Rudaea sp.]
MNPSYAQIRARIDAAAQAAGRAVRLLAVCKTQATAAIRELAAQGQRAFGENRVQEALSKQRELADLALEWHLIGPLQSKKCREAARHFDWVQSIDREKLIESLNRFRPADAPPLNVLIQVNIDAETSKSGCAPEAVPVLARTIAQFPRLRLRGLMAIPEPHPDPAQRRAAFARMRELLDALRTDHADIDTLSMGMSDDFELAIAEGATLVRIGTALFGARPHPQ